MNSVFYCHLHLSLGIKDGNVFVGHLNKAIVSAICEMMVQSIDSE